MLIEVKVEPNPEVCHLRSYDGEEISCHEEPDLLQGGEERTRGAKTWI